MVFLVLSHQSTFWASTAADWLAALGTIVALVFGIAALRTAQRERSERRTEGEQQRREAIRANARVYCWAEAATSPAENGGTVWIRNDTDLPVLSANVEVYSRSFAGVEHHMSMPALLPPRATISLLIAPDSFSQSQGRPMLMAWVSFTDVDGYNWTRHPSGELTPYPWPEGGLREPKDFMEGTPAPV